MTLVPFDDPLAELQQQNPIAATAMRAHATAAVLDAEAANPEADGTEKARIAAETLERRLLRLWEGMNKYVYDAPPLADLVVENVVIPYAPPFFVNHIQPHTDAAIKWAWEQLNRMGLFGHKPKTVETESQEGTQDD